MLLDQSGPSAVRCTFHSPPSFGAMNFPLSTSTERREGKELRISDWSSDVCSSDLIAGASRRPLLMVPRKHGMPGLSLWKVDKPHHDDRTTRLCRDPARRPGDLSDPVRLSDALGPIRPFCRQVHLPFTAIVRRNELSFVSRSEEHTPELQSLMRISFAVFCLEKTNNNTVVYTN